MSASSPTREDQRAADLHRQNQAEARRDAILRTCCGAVALVVTSFALLGGYSLMSIVAAAITICLGLLSYDAWAELRENEASRWKRRVRPAHEITGLSAPDAPERNRSE